MSRPLKWTNDHEKRYNALFKKVNMHYKNVDLQDYIFKKKAYLIGFIDSLQDYSSGTKENMLFMCARWLAINHPEEKQWIKAYQQSGYNLKVERDQKEGENELDEKELENLKPHEYFENILQKIDFYKIDNLPEHYQVLLLALLTYQPPLRTNFYITAKFVKHKNDVKPEENYIRLYKYKDKLKAQYIVGKDKASSYKAYVVNKELSIIEIEDPELVKMIYHSYRTYERTYLFQLKEKPISEKTLLQYLRNVTSVPLINIDMMRSSYVTWFFEHNKKFKEREALARKMRHSFSTSSKNYFKLKEDIPKDDDGKIQLIKDLENKIVEQDIKINQCMDEKTKCEVPEDSKLYMKRRRDLLYIMNKGHKAKASTIARYKFVFDEESKKWK
jgi:hypothetical protein